MGKMADSGRRSGVSRRTVLGGASAAAVALTVGFPTIAATRTGRAKNILLITTDQEQPWHKLPHQIGLPNHERLLGRSAHFENWTVNSVPCGPSRSNLYTGQHIQHTHIIDNPGFPPWQNSLDPAIPTLGTMFKQLGYKTAYKGKWHLSSIPADDSGSHMAGLQPFGFDEYQVAGEAYGLAHDGHDHDPEIAADAARWLMRRSRSDTPWLLCVNFLNPHDIMFYDATGQMDETLLKVRGSVVDLKPAPQVRPYGSQPQMGLPPTFRVPPRFQVPAHRIFAEDNELFLGRFEGDAEEHWLRYVNYYSDCLRDVDRHLGTVLEALDRSGLTDDTVIVFTADHGEMAGAHGYRQKGPFIYTENLGVPMIVSHPDGERGSTVAALGSAIDVVPTLVALSESPNAQSWLADRTALVGKDMSTLVADPSAPSPRKDGVLHVYSALYTGSPNVRRKRAAISFAESDVERSRLATQPPYFVEFENRSFYRGMSDGRYRFARYFSPRDHHTPETWDDLIGRNDPELYDIAQDPLEQTNLAAQPEANRDLIMALNAKLNRLIAAEVGTDDGRHMPGSAFQWSL